MQNLNFSYQEWTPYRTDLATDRTQEYGPRIIPLLKKVHRRVKKEYFPPDGNPTYIDPSSLFPYEHQLDMPAENPPQLEEPVLWRQHETLQPEFLEQHRDAVLCDILNRIKTLLLYPPHCNRFESIKENESSQDYGNCKEVNIDQHFELSLLFLFLLRHYKVVQ